MWGRAITRNRRSELFVALTDAVHRQVAELVVHVRTFTYSEVMRTHSTLRMMRLHLSMYSRKHHERLESLRRSPVGGMMAALMPSEIASIEPARLSRDRMSNSLWRTTMPPMNTLHDLMIHQLRDIYSAEKQLVQALPKMARNATSEELQNAFRSHLQETEEHVSRLEQGFEMLGVTGRGMKCKAMEGLIEEGAELLEEEVAPAVLDAALIAAAQRIEHYEIAAYGTVCEYARSMGHDELLSLLDSTLAEEKQADETLTSLAETGINALAEEMGEEEEGSKEDAEEGSEQDSNEKGASAKSAKNGAPATRAKDTGAMTKQGGRQTREPAKRAADKKAKR